MDWKSWEEILRAEYRTYKFNIYICQLSFDKKFGKFAVPQPICWIGLKIYAQYLRIQSEVRDLF